MDLSLVRITSIEPWTNHMRAYGSDTGLYMGSLLDYVSGIYFVAPLGASLYAPLGLGALDDTVDITLIGS